MPGTAFGRPAQRKTRPCAYPVTRSPDVSTAMTGARFPPTGLRTRGSAHPLVPGGRVTTNGSARSGVFPRALCASRAGPLQRLSAGGIKDWPPAATVRSWPPAALCMLGTPQCRRWPPPSFPGHKNPPASNPRHPIPICTVKKWVPSPNPLTKGRKGDCGASPRGHATIAPAPLTHPPAAAAPPGQPPRLACA